MKRDADFYSKRMRLKPDSESPEISAGNQAFTIESMQSLSRQMQPRKLLSGVRQPTNIRPPH
jgi:hypothetical protein